MIEEYEKFIAWLEGHLLAFDKTRIEQYDPYETIRDKLFNIKMLQKKDIQLRAALLEESK